MEYEQGLHVISQYKEQLKSGFPQWNKLSKGVQSIIIDRATYNSLETTHSLRLVNKWFCDEVWKLPTDNRMIANNAKVFNANQLPRDTALNKLSFIEKLLNVAPDTVVYFMANKHADRFLAGGCGSRWYPLIRIILNALVACDTIHSNVTTFISRTTGVYRELYREIHSKIYTYLPASSRTWKVSTCIMLGLWNNAKFKRHATKVYIEKNRVTLEDWTCMCEWGMKSLSDTYWTFIMTATESTTTC